MGPAEIILILIVIIVVISFIIYFQIEKKVDETLSLLLSELSKYHSLLNINISVQTNNLKISKWNRQHRIDYIINNKHHEIESFLNLYHQYQCFWAKNIEHFKILVEKKAEEMQSIMPFFAPKYKERVKHELKRLLEEYRPENVRFTLETNTVHSSAERYNSQTRQWWKTESNIEITSSSCLSPLEINNRIDVLNKYSFELTEFENSVKNQRLLITNNLREEIIRRDEGICQYCGVKCNRNEIEIDHIFPVSKGGKSNIGNLQVLCKKCNREKSDKIIWGKQKRNPGSISVRHNNPKIQIYKTGEVSKNPKNIEYPQVESVRLPITMDEFVFHNTFGEGRITSFDGKYITISFSNQEKIFIYPESFHQGFLRLK